MSGVSRVLTAAVLVSHATARGVFVDDDSTPMTQPVVPVDNMAYYLTQGTTCLDVYESSGILGLYDCWGYYQANQEFVWRKDSGMTAHLISNPALGGKCVTIEGPSGQRPADSAPAMLLECDPTNTNAQWSYNFERKTMNLAQHPDLCLDHHHPGLAMFGFFNAAWTPHFAIYPCQNSMFNLMGPGTQDNQIINVEPFNYHYDTTPRGPLVETPEDGGTYLLTFGDYCLDFHHDGDQVVLYTCNQQMNQEFQWRAVDDGAFEISTHSDVGLCLDIDGTAGQRPENGAKLTFRRCVAGDPRQTWRYDSERQMLRSAPWADLCADFMNAGGIMSTDHYVASTCKAVGEDPENQKVNIEPLPGQYAPAPPALNASVPPALAEPVPALNASVPPALAEPVPPALAGAFALPPALGLGGRSFGAVAVAAACAFAALAGLAVAARRRRHEARGGDDGDDLLEGQWLE